MRRISDSVRLVSVRQKEPLGLGHAVLAARHAVGAEWFGVLLGDDLIDSADPAIGQLARVVQKTGKAAVALMPVPESQVHLYGVGAARAIDVGHIEVERIVEKPPRDRAPSNLAVIDRYGLPADVFDIGTFSAAAFDVPFMFAWYSGYIVTAPPRVGSTGIQLSLFSHSVSAVF